MSAAGLRGPAYIAGKYGCHVVGVDISEKMIEWSRRPPTKGGREQGRVPGADVLDLPFEADRFDIVMVESVLIFVEDKVQAIRDAAVTRPGAMWD